MDKHLQQHGQLVEAAVRRRGINLSDLAKELGVNRRTIYNWFQSPNLKRDVIYRIGLRIGHDFSVEFPELFTSDMFSNERMRTLAYSNTITGNEGSDWKEKYITLLEKYNEILSQQLR
ncbi:helix-turn-helix domain-containing protein [Mucilaginibacter sp. JRF]|uniref:helix-turn-helix domain-containing protein n=1 Tax=Mucilaginibacter sp. JRF TaxID=2780088 RepID=UPI00188205BA|nr:helix-turn-helix domain-containing protein [Mucilaginibacter sp. JRF]MBE9583765.1 helix-turn-helix domain-containing protein [Mucilaginibacter sp. JRF]